jgi:uncharacterized protein (TIGR02145 family)
MEIDSVKIGNQEWSSQNISIKHFKNGDTISFASSFDDWINAGKNKKPAWCHINNDEKNETSYGVFYNGFVLTDARGIIPDGWRLPTRNDIRELKDFLEKCFGKEKYLKEIKSTFGWLKYKEFKNFGDDDYRPTGRIINPNGTNKTGLSIAASGYRSINNDSFSSTADEEIDISKHNEGFHFFGKEAKFWMEKPLNDEDNDNLPYFDIADDNLGFSGWTNKATGFTIRLIKKS